MRLKCQIFCACELFCEYLDLVAYYLLIGLQLVNLYPKYIIKIKVDILGENLNVCTLTLKP